jgi:excisionase family DNA binding protein
VNARPTPFSVMPPMRAPALLVVPVALRLGDAARALAVSTRTVRRLVASGELAASRIGRVLVIEVRELEAFLAKTRIGRAP